MDTVCRNFIILGAGPAGLQMAYFLEKAGQDYLVLEKGMSAGETFKRFPRHRTLISINKRFTGSDDPNFNLRHDWNSLLCENQSISFKDYDENFFPHADNLVNYLKDYSDKFSLNVQCDTDIVRISKTEAGQYLLKDAKGNSYITSYLIVATGFQKSFMPAIPGIEFAECYSQMSIDRKRYENKRVLIIGKGNSGFETADHLVSSAALIHVASPNPINMAWKTHYVGNLRAINNNFLDTYQLKSQNAVLDVDILSIVKNNKGQLSATVKYRHAEDEIEVIEYDHVLVCTGFRFNDSIFDMSAKPETIYNGKYPKIGYDFESTNNRNMYFAGTLTHSLDYKKATSGFIHGFRYNTKALFRILNMRLNGAEIAGTFLKYRLDELAEAMLLRMNSADGIWQQPGFLADAFVVEGDSVAHIQELPLGYIVEKYSAHEVFTLTLEYGAPIEGDPFNVERIHRQNIDRAERSQFLHPVVRRYKSGMLLSKHDVIEDLEAKWTGPEHIDPLKMYLEYEGVAMGEPKTKAMPKTMAHEEDAVA